MSAHDSGNRPGPGYETRDLALRPVVYAGIFLIALAALAHVGMWLLLRGYALREAERAVSSRPLASELRREAPPEPRLQASPRNDLLALRRWEDRMLTTYAWVDHDRGTVRIPLDRALELVLERGLPARKERPQ